MKKITPAYLKLQDIRFKRQRARFSIKIGTKQKLLEQQLNRVTAIRKEYLTAFGEISSKVLKIKKRQKEFEVIIPKDFSLYNDPSTVLDIIYNISQLKKHSQVKSIYINHSLCESHDLAAEILLASSVSNLKLFKTSRGAKFRVHGLMPERQSMCHLLRTIGVVKETANTKYHLKSKEQFELFKRVSQPTEKVEIIGIDKKARATSGFTDYMNGCLKFISAKLDRQEEKKLNRYIGELLGNAEDHSGKKLWNIVGYLDASDRCNLTSEAVIFNVGKTITETFEDKINSDIVYKKLQEYIDKHHNHCSKEQLTMVHALQQNASSKKDITIDRGQGTKYLIDLFEHLSNECSRINKIRKVQHSNARPKMLVLSGNVMIQFDGTYTHSVTDNKMVYAFNESNNLDLAPDKCYIPMLDKGVTFPGTVIYIKFPLYEETLASNHNESD